MSNSTKQADSEAFTRQEDAGKSKPGQGDAEAVPPLFFEETRLFIRNKKLSVLLCEIDLQEAFGEFLLGAGKVIDHLCRGRALTRPSDALETVAF